MYLGHRLDLSGSRDVIGHVTIRFPTPHFLYNNHLDLCQSHELCTTCHLQLKLHLTKVLLVFRHDSTNRLTGKLEGSVGYLKTPFITEMIGV